MRNRNEFVQLIDRYRLGQVQRLTIGLSVEADFSAIRGSLMLAEGRGKFLRVRWIENREQAVPANIAGPCCEVVRYASGNDNPQGSSSLRDFSQLRIDLTRLLATAVNQLATISGNHSRMLMDVCVTEPGLWLCDYDGAQSFQSFCEPTLLAELTGLTTITTLPCRDLAAGGRGWPLEPLTQWLMFADRDRTIAETPRLLIHSSEFTELVWIPESDGLDNELPAIRYDRVLGEGFERQLIAACGQDELDASRRDEFGAQGKVHTGLARLWSDFVARQDLSRAVPATEAMETLVQDSIELINSQQLSLGDALRTFAFHVTNGIQQFIDRPSCRGKVQLIAGGAIDRHGLILSEINSVIDREWFDTSAINYDPLFLQSSTAALAGLMSMDQMPATIPWLTGSELPRVLGSLTPGSPANWRRVIMEMGDCRPPVMKLRDAV